MGRQIVSKADVADAWREAVIAVERAMTDASGGYFVRNMEPGEIAELATIAVNVAWEHHPHNG